MTQPPEASLKPCLIKFLEGHGFYSVPEKLVGTGFLILIIAFGIIGISIFGAWAMYSPWSFFPVLAAIVVFGLWFKSVGVVCPMCDERIERPDRYYMDDGGWCHEWCAYLLERKE
jgi:hypothetical protein